MARVKAAQQHQGGSGNNFESQVRHSNGGRKKEKRSQKQIYKDEYAKRIGQTKPKQVVQEHCFMGSCHCRGKGTCTYCVEQKKRSGPRHEKKPQYGDILYYTDRDGRRYTKWAPDRSEVYYWG